MIKCRFNCKLILDGRAENNLTFYSTATEGENIIQRDTALRERLIITGLIIAALATRFFYIYQGGMSEPDSVVMAAGMARMLSPDCSFVESMLYGRQLNPGIYFIFKAIYPLIFDSPEYVIEFLNWLGALSAALITWPLYLILRKMFSRTISAGAVLIFIFSPITWELGTYFHPIMPALLLALIAFLTFNRISSSPKGIIYFVITSLAGSAAVIMRTEVLFVLPPAAVYILFSRQRRKNLVVLFSISAIAIVSYLALMAMISGPASTGGRGLRGFTERFISMYFKSVSMTGILKTTVWAVMGIGVATVILIIIYSLNNLFRKGRIVQNREGRKVLITSLFWILPSLIIWLLYPVPITRHFFIVIPAAVVILSETVFKRYPNGRIAIIATSIIILNLAIPEILYRGYNSISRGSEKEPHGTFFYYHSRVNERISRYHKMQKEIEDIASKGPGYSSGLFIPVNWESYGYALYGMAETGELVYEGSSEISPGMFIHEYSLFGTDVVLAFSNDFRGKSIPDQIFRKLKRALSEGRIVVLPKDLTDRKAMSKMPDGFSITY